LAGSGVFGLRHGDGAILGSASGQVKAGPAGADAVIARRGLRVSINRRVIIYERVRAKVP